MSKEENLAFYLLIYAIHISMAKCFKKGDKLLDETLATPTQLYLIYIPRKMQTVKYIRVNHFIMLDI